MPILKEVCQRYLQNRKEVELDVKGLIHISREGRDLLQKIHKRTILVHPPRSIIFSKTDHKKEERIDQQIDRDFK